MIDTNAIALELVKNAKPVVPTETPLEVIVPVPLPVVESKTPMEDALSSFDITKATYHYDKGYAVIPGDGCSLIVINDGRYMIVFGGRHLR